MKSLAAAFFALTFATFAMFSAQASATDPEICQIRGALMGSVAQERDKGVSKAEVKRIFTRKFGGKFSGFRGYVDLVYNEMKDMSPNEVAKFTVFACNRE